MFIHTESFHKTRAQKNQVKLGFHSRHIRETFENGLEIIRNIMERFRICLE